MKIAYGFISMGWGIVDKGTNKITWDFIKNNYNYKMIQRSINEFETYKNNLIRKSRKEIGDDLNNISDRAYGNNVLSSGSVETDNACLGIISGVRNNNLGIDGISNGAKLMPIRAVSNRSANDKDIALAIDYAVSNGANIICLNISKDIVSNYSFVENALKNAQKQNILVIREAGYIADALKTTCKYPSKYIDGKEFDNFLYVGAAQMDANPTNFTCYGQEVDLLAPGIDIYANSSNGNYNKQTSLTLPTAIVGGIAALVWQYYPMLKASELKQILIESVIKQNKQVVLPRVDPRVDDKIEADYSKVCKSAGIVNAYNALRIAKYR
jgi:hypothetical protein